MASGVPLPELVGVASRLRVSILEGRGELDLDRRWSDSCLTTSSFLFSTTTMGSDLSAVVLWLTTTGREVLKPTAMFFDAAFTTVAGTKARGEKLCPSAAAITLGFFGGLSCIMWS